MKIIVASFVLTSFLLVGIRCDSMMSPQSDGDENSPGEKEAPVKDAGNVKSTVIHAERGNPDESLVDQMKKLSEKIKVEQQKNKEEIEQADFGSSDLDHVKSTVIYAEAGKPDESLVDQMQKLSEKIKAEKINEETSEQVNINKRYARDVDNVLVDKTDNKDNNEVINDDNSDNILKFKETISENFETLENVIDEENDEPSESVMEQMLKIEQKINNGELGESEHLKPSYDHADLSNDDIEKEMEEIFAEIDSLGKSADEMFEGDDEISVEKTMLPKTDVLPSETMVVRDYGKDQSITKDANNARATRVLEQVKSTIQDSTIVNDRVVMATTATIDSVESSSKIYSGKEKLKLRLDKHRKSESSDQTQQNILNGVSSTTMKLSSSKFDDRKISYNGDTRFVPTSQNMEEDVKPVEMSEDEPRGMMYETDVYKEDKKTVTTTESIHQGKLHIPTETKLNQGPTDTLSKMTKLSDDVKDQTESVKSTDTEMSEEDKLNIEKAQQYFEDGEKLINTSYKRDYVQAYEYFKLAADMGHTKALEYMGFGYLLGDYITMNPTKALETFHYLSDKGKPKGQLGLGFSYSSGLAVNSSQAKALIYFSFAALGGDSLAQMVLGYRYLSGVGVESKCETALTYYRKVATTVAEQTSSGSPIIQRIRLHEHAENKDNGPGSLMDDDLLQYYEFLADKGDVQAQVALGQLYYQGGRGVTVNHARAQHYFLMAAESGNGNALAFLGKMHSEGSPVIKQDSDIAFQYFLKAADKANPIGQCGLGIIYLYGKGVPKDYQKALKYFSLSSDQGWSDAQLHLGIMHFGGKGLRRDYKMAVKYFNLASQGGHVLAFYHLAQMHATGTGVLRNCHTAVELYKNVAERGTWASMLVDAHELYKNGQVNEALLKYTFLAELGYEVAQTNVAYILDNGESSLFDEKETYQRALLHWTRAASQGSTVARLKMGDYHYYGYGTDIDYETAATHYRLATEQQHNAQAMFNLGYMHENGLGLKQDVHLAKRFYDMAAETSGDAYIPVTLALFKLGVFYGTEVFNKEIETYYSFVNKLDIRYQLGPYWDIYLATFLAIVLSIIVVVVRQNR